MLFSCLVLSGGGVKGYAYPGALRALGELGKLEALGSVAGTSIGALFEVLTALRCTADEMDNIADHLDLGALRSGPSRWWALRIARLWETLGMCSESKGLEPQLIKAIQGKLPSITTETLGELYARTQIDLVIAAGCLTRQKAVYFSHATFPHVRVLDALLASMAIPGYFSPHRLVCYPDGLEDAFVDGGVVDNYPLGAFSHLRVLKGDRVDPDALLGLKFCTGTGELEPAWRPVTTVLEEGRAIVELAMHQLDVEGMQRVPGSVHRTVHIPVGQTQALELSISLEARAALRSAGYQAVHRFFEAPICARGPPL